jgi:hypothetical protein
MATGRAADLTDALQAIARISQENGDLKLQLQELFDTCSAQSHVLASLGATSSLGGIGSGGSGGRGSGGGNGGGGTSAQSLLGVGASSDRVQPVALSVKVQTKLGGSVVTSKQPRPTASKPAKRVGRLSPTFAFANGSSGVGGTARPSPPKPLAPKPTKPKPVTFGPAAVGGGGEIDLDNDPIAAELAKAWNDEPEEDDDGADDSVFAVGDAALADISPERKAAVHDTFMDTFFKSRTLSSGASFGVF